MSAEGQFTAVLETMAEARNYNAFLLRQVLAHAPAGARTVDFGAGIGTFAEGVRAAGLPVQCVELDDAQRAHMARLGLATFRGLDELPDASQDYAYSLNVLEHIPDDLAAMRELHRVLRPGGTLFLYVPAFQVLFGNMDRKVGHVRRYRAAGLRRLAEAAGFAVDEVRYADSLGFFVTLLFNAIGAKDGSVDKRSIVVYDRVVFPVSRALDPLLGRLFGKNVMLSARKVA